VGLAGQMMDRGDMIVKHCDFRLGGDRSSLNAVALINDDNRRVKEKLFLRPKILAAGLSSMV
jgi:hypothetical protein